MDLSKLPRKPQAPDAGSATPASPSVPQPPTDHSSSAAQIGLGADIWFMSIVGLVLIYCGRSFISYELAQMRHQPYHTGVTWNTSDKAGEEVAYPDLDAGGVRGGQYYTDSCLFLFGVAARNGRHRTRACGDANARRTGSPWFHNRVDVGNCRLQLLRRLEIPRRGFAAVYLRAGHRIGRICGDHANRVVQIDRASPEPHKNAPHGGRTVRGSGREGSLYGRPRRLVASIGPPHCVLLRWFRLPTHTHEVDDSNQHAIADDRDHADHVIEESRSHFPAPRHRGVLFVTQC